MYTSDADTKNNNELYAVLPHIVAKGVPQKGMTATIYKLVMYVFSIIDIKSKELSGKRIDINIKELNRYMGRELHTNTDFLERAKERDIIFSDKKINIKIFSKVENSDTDHYVVLDDSLLNYAQVNKDKDDMFFKVDIFPVLKMNTRRNYYSMMMYIYLSMYLDKENNEKLIKSCSCKADMIKSALGIEKHNIYLLKRHVLSVITEAFNNEPYSKIFVTYTISGEKVELFAAKKKFFSDYDEFFNAAFSSLNKTKEKAEKKAEEKVARVVEQNKIDGTEKHNVFMRGLCIGIFVGGIIGGITSALIAAY